MKSVDRNMQDLHVTFQPFEGVLIGSIEGLMPLKTSDENFFDSVFIEAISAILPDKNIILKTPLLGAHKWTGDFKNPPLIIQLLLFFLGLYDFLISIPSYILALLGLEKLLSPHRRAVRQLLHKYYFKQFSEKIKDDGLRLIEADFKDLSLIFTLNKKKIPTYIDSLADHSLNEPDYLIASNSEIKNSKQLKSLIDFNILYRNVFYSRDEIGKEWKAVDRMLDSILMIGVLYERDFRFYTKASSKDEIIERLKSLTHKHGLSLIINSLS